MKPTDVKSITYIRVFPTGGWVRRIPLPPTKTLIIPVKSPPLHCHLEKFRPIDSPSPTTQRLIPPLINNLHVITPPPPPSHCSCTISIFNFIPFAHTGHANSDFNWRSIFTESYFQLFKNLWIIKITPPQISTTQ